MDGVGVAFFEAIRFKTVFCLFSFLLFKQKAMVKSSNNHQDKHLTHHRPQKYEGFMGER